MAQNNNRRGSVLVFLFAGIALVAVILTGYFFYQTKQVQKKNTEENKKVEETVKSPLTVKEETANWKTYTSTIYNYKIKYPPEWKISSQNSPEKLESASIVNFRRTDDATPAQSGYSLGVLDPENLLISKKCLKDGPFTSDNDLNGILCDRNVQSTIKTIGGIDWEVLTNNSVGYIPTGSVDYDVVHNNKLYYVVNFTGQGDTFFYNQILSTFKFL